MLFDQEFIKERLPHRDPFLWLDSVTSLDNDQIIARKFISPDLDIFKGHYPNFPILPGVILCEAVFQAGALLISEQVQAEDISRGVPVITRVEAGKFKRQVVPNDELEIFAEIIEKVGSVWFLKGKIKVAGKLAMKVSFACTLASIGN